jgi:hypothetical protein
MLYFFNTITHTYRTFTSDDKKIIIIDSITLELFPMYLFPSCNNRENVSLMFNNKQMSCMGHLA